MKSSKATKFIVIPTKTYRRNVRRQRKRCADLTKLENILNALQQGLPLLPRHRHHRLLGSPGCYELHISSDWLLTYQVSGNTLRLLRLGTHSDIF